MSVPTFRITPLPIQDFAPFFAMSDDDLASRGMRRVIADRKPGFPCRVSLQDADVGERVLLLPYRHHEVEGPYASSGPIFVREKAVPAKLPPGLVPESVQSRLLSIRAYDPNGMMVASEVIDGVALPAWAERLFGAANVAYVHVHNAKAGCYSCRIDRV